MPVALVLFVRVALVPVLLVLVALVLGGPSLTLRLLSRLLGTVDVARMAGMFGIVTLLAATA